VSAAVPPGTPATPALPRELGRHDRGVPGPTLLVLAGVHGNEPAGVAAAQRVLAELVRRDAPIRGRIVAFAGNLGALALGRRYQHRDLNRGWGAAAIAAMAQRVGPDRSPEDDEQRDLLRGVADVLATATGPALFVDLHTSSADGPPFLCLADTIDNRRLGLATGVPIILGIEETIDGAALEWFGARGVAALAVEGGRHQHPDTVGNHEAVLWLLLARIGAVPPDVADVPARRACLERAVGRTPRIVEITRRHAITPADAFAMAPGFVNFDRVRRGQVLARDVRGDVRAEADRRVLLPLYQPQGDDGFFLARPVAPFWLRVAAVLRSRRADALLPFLPGIRRDPADPDTLLADRRVARWFTVEVFRLLGYRRERPRGDRLLAFTRRRSRPENRRL